MPRGTLLLTESVQHAIVWLELWHTPQPTQFGWLCMHAVLVGSAAWNNLDQHLAPPPSP